MTDLRADYSATELHSLPWMSICKSENLFDFPADAAATNGLAST